MSSWKDLAKDDLLAPHLGSSKLLRLRRGKNRSFQQTCIDLCAVNLKYG